MKLFILFSFIGALDASCPNEQCWSYNSVLHQCDFKSSPECDYSLECSYGGMRFVFPGLIFESDAPIKAEDFHEIEECTPVFDQDLGKFVWEKNLGECGIILKNENDQLEFEKTLSVGPDDGIVNLGGVDIYSNAPGSFAFSFMCKYDTTATAESEEMQVKRGGENHAFASSTGSFQEGLSIKYFTDFTFQTPSEKSYMLGDTLYAEVSWAVATLEDKIHFYVKNCQVQDLNDQRDQPSGIHIIKDSCFSSATGAGPIGEARDSKMVARKSQFRYVSFAYDRSRITRQKLKCEIKFCYIKENQSSCDDELDVAKTPCSSEVPALMYSPNGVFDNHDKL